MPYFRAFSAFLVTATNFMNSITFVMNHLISYFDISICHCSNRTLCYHLFKFHGFNHGYFLGGACYIHLTMGTNSVFSGFSAFSVTVTNFMNSSTFVWRIHRNSQLKKATLYILTNNTLKVKTSKLHFTRKAVLKS